MLLMALASAPAEPLGRRDGPIGHADRGLVLLVEHVCTRELCLQPRHPGVRPQVIEAPCRSFEERNGLTDLAGPDERCTDTRGAPRIRRPVFTGVVPGDRGLEQPDRLVLPTPH